MQAEQYAGRSAPVLLADRRRQVFSHQGLIIDLNEPYPSNIEINSIKEMDVNVILKFNGAHF